MNVSSSQPEGGRRSYDVDLNIVPLVDVMSLLVVFLIVTTVWTSMAQLRVANDPKGLGAALCDQACQQQKQIAILATREGILLGAGENARIELGLDDVEGLRQTLREAAAPELRVQVAAESGVPYERIVSIMDTALGAGYERVTFVDEGMLGARFRR
jgi:biopolymer transport protein ExbD